LLKRFLHLIKVIYLQHEKQYPSICYSCEKARKVADTNEQKGYVGCIIRFLNGGTNRDYLEIEEGKEVAEGWIYSKRSPFSKSSGTLGEGVMSNLQLITKEIKSCRQYIKNIHEKTYYRKRSFKTLVP